MKNDLWDRQSPQDLKWTSNQDTIKEEIPVEEELSTPTQEVQPPLAAADTIQHCNRPVTTKQSRKTSRTCPVRKHRYEPFTPGSDSVPTSLSKTLKAKTNRHKIGFTKTPTAAMRDNHYYYIYVSTGLNEMGLVFVWPIGLFLLITSNKNTCC